MFEPASLQKFNLSSALIDRKIITRARTAVAGATYFMPQKTFLSMGQRQNQLPNTHTQLTGYVQFGVLIGISPSAESLKHFISGIFP